MMLKKRSPLRSLFLFSVLLIGAGCVFTIASSEAQNRDSRAESFLITAATPLTSFEPEEALASGITYNGDNSPSYDPMNGGPKALQASFGSDVDLYASTHPVGVKTKSSIGSAQKGSDQ